MFPLRDNIPSRSICIITILLIILNLYIYYQEILLSDALLTKIIKRYGLIPARLTAITAQGSLDFSPYVTLISNLFLHGGWMHVLGNMWYMWVFADNVEDWLGHFRFIIFYLACGVIANITHIVLDPSSTIPTIGASGAVSGILGAYLVLYPKAKVKTLVPIFVFLSIFEIPAVIFLGLWFIFQLFSGTAALHSSGSNIAWWAHIGGFIGGMILIRFFRRR